jgi:hypothetical protein
MAERRSEFVRAEEYGFGGIDAWASGGKTPYPVKGRAMSALPIVFLKARFYGSRIFS